MKKRELSIFPIIKLPKRGNVETEILQQRVTKSEGISVIELGIRYAILALFSLGNLYLLYKIFAPLTIYISAFILNKIYGALVINGNIIYFKGISAEISRACVAVSAYFLLLILNLTTPMKIKRLKSIIFLLFTFLVLNILRIVIFAALFYIGYSYFDAAHRFVWYIGSTILVIAIWFANVKLFRIKEIPVYTDVRNILKSVKK